MQLFQKNYERYSAPFVVMYAHQKGTLIRAARLYPTAKSKFKHEFVVTGKYASSISSSVLQQLNEVTPFFARLSFKCHSKSGPARSIFSLPPKVTEKEKQDLRALYARLKREGKPVQETPADIDIDVELMQYYDGHLAGAYVLKETALGSGEREKLTTRLPKEEKEKTIIKKFVIRQTAPLVELGSAEYDCVFINKNAKNEKGKVAMELLLPQAVSGRKSTARVA
ncbi:hypothetical protein HZC09_00970 [Candidatus Micrarchaeota archaeon]|nr:hypothetical protein [Candidatus Micrarchaeota archaeon]